MLILKNVSKRYCKNVLNNFSYCFKKGSIYSIIGPSGSGKTTLLNIIANNIKRYKGDVYYNNVNIKTLKNYTYKNVAYVKQNYQLFDELTTLENILLHHYLNDNKVDNLIYKIKTLLSYFKIDHLINSKVKYVSGGEKQRIAIIKAIIKDCPIMILDEPTSALDEESKSILLNYLNNIKKDKIIILVTHDLSLANTSDEIIDLKNINKINIEVNETKIQEEKLRFKGLSLLYKKVIKSKKVFSYICSAILSFSLISISLSFVIKDFINDIVASSFSVFNSDEYVTFKTVENNKDIDFSSLSFQNIDYIFYEGIASDIKDNIKDNSNITQVLLNDIVLADKNFVFDNYLSMHHENFVLYVPESIKNQLHEINYLTIYYLNQSIKIKIDNIYASNDETYYIYCNNISYLSKYFYDTNISLKTYKYVYSEDIEKLYNHLIYDYTYKDYLFYLYKDNNVIQIIKNNYSRISTDILNKLDCDYIVSDFVHTYIDYDSGLIYLLGKDNYQIVIDDNLLDNHVGVSKKISIENNLITIFNTKYDVDYISENETYSIIYMNSNTFNNLNNLDLVYVGIMFKNNYRTIDEIIINDDLFDNKSISGFNYISDFLLFLSLIIIILAILSTISVFTINFISKKKDVLEIKQMGVYNNKIIMLLLKEPFFNILQASVYAVIFTVLAKVLVTILYKQLSKITLAINVSLSFLMLLFILPFICILPIMIIKSYRYLLDNIKK